MFDNKPIATDQVTTPFHSTYHFSDYKSVTTVYSKGGAGLHG